MHRVARLARTGLALIAPAGLPSGGCAQHRTVTTEEHVHQTTTTAPAASSDHTVHETTSTTVVEREPKQGLLSGLVHTVGQVLALPFRLPMVVGGLLQLIF